MKTLIVYSTISGNTKSVCERIYGALNTEKEIKNKLWGKEGIYFKNTKLKQ